MSADLHCHTKLSDGSLGIEELINLAVKKNITTLAITDHDCLLGTVRGKIIGERKGIKVIPAVELSATDPDNGKQVHILAYCCDYPDRIAGLCQSNSVARKKAGQYMMLKASQKYPISSDLVIKCQTGSASLYKQHILHALMECGCTTSIYGDVYEKLFNPQTEGNIITVPKFASVEDVIKTVHDAGGISVLAHPYLYNNIEDIDKYISYGLCGIEVWHPTCPTEKISELVALGKKKKLLMTGGSDFHGMFNRNVISLGDYSTPDSNLSELLSYKAKQKRLQKKLSQEG